MADASLAEQIANSWIVQLGIALTVLSGGLVAVVRGSRSDPGPEVAPETRVYLGGVVQPILEHAQGTHHELKEMREENQRTVAEFRERHERELELMRDVARAIGDLAKSVGDFGRSVNELARDLRNGRRR